MESKKISNDQEFIQPDSILLPQKRKRSSRDTHGTYTMHTYKFSHHLGTARKAKGYGGLCCKNRGSLSCISINWKCRTVYEGNTPGVWRHFRRWGAVLPSSHNTKMPKSPGSLSLSFLKLFCYYMYSPKSQKVSPSSVKIYKMYKHAP